jgi:hypothetical protein
MDQRVYESLHQGQTRSVKNGREVRTGPCFSTDYVSQIANTISRKLLKGLEKSRWEDK